MNQGANESKLVNYLLFYKTTGPNPKAIFEKWSELLSWQALYISEQGGFSLNLSVMCF